MLECKVAPISDDDTVSKRVKEAFSALVAFGVEDAFKGRFSGRLASISIAENKKLIPIFLKIMMN